MRGAGRLAATLLAALSAGCATSVKVEFDASRDFSRYRTWGWLPRGRNVSALPGEEPGLRALIGGLVDQELRRRQLERVDAGADLLVGYELRVRRRAVAVNETGAEGYLSSHHASPSYLVQATTSRIDVYDHGYLWIVVTDGRRQSRLWWGELWARRRGEFARHLPDLVSRLLADFPAGDSAEPLSTAGN